ncbi:MULTISPECIES: transposase [Mesorhizobium]|nr:MULTISPECIES: transposase [Mesorhizobium]MCF6101861.1 transposase [Mesorhizobium muleiense]RUV30850.1 hypothetical protein EOA86_09205 [Mesorhizobium sp. M5C.F.Ca.IN.020.32.2.1]RWP11049.1 MAG: hypothetical protein EOR00_29605 [Mesorhizobium sp.]
MTAVFPLVQTCIVHLIRHYWSSCHGRTATCRAGVRAKYRAKAAEAGLAALDAFEACVFR